MVETARQPIADEAQARADTTRWLSRAVIGLNLCPFAKSVFMRGQIHLATFLGSDDNDLLDALLLQADQLIAEDPATRETTLLIAPNLMPDFLEFNAFVSRAERQLCRRGFDGRLQLATFHPKFEFAGSGSDDITNATNKSPYPTLHLLREESVTRAVKSFPDAAAIFERNIATLQSLGEAGWAELNVGPGAAKP